MTNSILDDLGQEVTGIVAPVSICMFLTVLLVRLLNPEGNSNPSAVAIAQTFYKEQESDSAGTKFEGALINAAIFVLIVGVMTFVLFLLFKYGCENVIYAYMGFAAFSIFFVIAGIVALQLLQMQTIPLDLVSFFFILWNFSVVGTVTMFVWPAPVLMKQGYMVITGVIMAFLFTGIPEWTTWTLLIAMALYDIAAVLTPNGPLKLLVELAQERDADIPALVYEARPTGRGEASRSRRMGDQGPLQTPQEQAPGEELELTDQSSRSSQSQDAANTSRDIEGALQEGATVDDAVGRRRQGARQATDATMAGGIGYLATDESTGAAERADDQVELDNGGEDAPLMSQAAEEGQRTHRSRGVSSSSAAGNEASDYSLPDAIKLGMGDFIFYSVLVGRAAMYDMLTVFASYLAIVAGLGATLILLALFHKALPALPISIALGVSFYFLSRSILEPFVVPLSTHLLYF